VLALLIHAALLLVEPVAAPGPIRFAQLPAVSDDGKLVAVSFQVSDGARANDNLTFALIDADADRVVESVLIVDAAHPERPGRAKRRAAAEALLAKRTWRRLRKLEMRGDPRAPERHGPVGGPFQAEMAVGEGLRVTYREPTLTVRETQPKGRELLRRAARELSVKGRKADDCPAPLASVATAAVDRATGILLLEIKYDGGSDVCWEPNEAFHVVRLPR
jgi:hypothetical protein